MDFIDSEVGGEEFRISRRKTLLINHVESISFDGCHVTIVLDVELMRRIRRDAHGTVTVEGNVVVTLVGDTAVVCISDTRVTDVDLSHARRLGEAVYRWIANLVIPDKGYFEVSTGFPI